MQNAQEIKVYSADDLTRANSGVTSAEYHAIFCLLLVYTNAHMTASVLTFLKQLRHAHPYQLLSNGPSHKLVARI